MHAEFSYAHLEWLFIAHITLRYHGIYAQSGARKKLHFLSIGLRIFSSCFISVVFENGTLQCPDSQAYYADYAVCDYYDDCGTNYDEIGCPEEGKIKLIWQNLLQNIITLCLLVFENDVRGENTTI